MNITHPDSVPDDFNVTSNRLERLVEAINRKLERRAGGIYDNHDGTFDRFRCVVYFDGNNPQDPDYHLWPDWIHYHAFVMDAYRQAGWTVKDKWITVKHNDFDVPCYCLAIPEKPITELIEELQTTKPEDIG